MDKALKFGKHMKRKFFKRRQSEGSFDSNDQEIAMGIENVLRITESSAFVSSKNCNARRKFVLDYSEKFISSSQTFRPRLNTSSSEISRTSSKVSNNSSTRRVRFADSRNNSFTDSKNNSADYSTSFVQPFTVENASKKR